MIELLLIGIKVVVVTLIVFALPLPLTYIERKVAGHIQVRLGPYRVGPHGILQPFADMVKLMFKEDIIPAKADPWLFRIAPVIAMVPAFAVFATIPFGEKVTLPILNYEEEGGRWPEEMRRLCTKGPRFTARGSDQLGGWASN